MKGIDSKLQHACARNGMKITRSVSNLGSKGNKSKVISIIDYVRANKLRIESTQASSKLAIYVVIGC